MRAWWPLALALLAAALAYALRFALVEPQAVAVVCDAEPLRDATCALRWATIQAFAAGRLGLFALAAALLATLTRWRWLAALALGSAVAAAVLYTAGLAVPAALLAALVFVRRG